MSLLANRDHEDRPWGSFDRFTANELSTVKILHALPNSRLSLQRHAHRSEWWKVLEGEGFAEINGEHRNLSVGDEVEISVGVTHRIGSGDSGITWLENDIERLDDDFGRVTDPAHG
jgi:mannose-6-phosphate isomerase